MRAPVPDPALQVARQGRALVLTYAQVVASSGDEQVGRFPPDVELPVSWADWSVGRDRALEEALLGVGGAGG